MRPAPLLLLAALAVGCRADLRPDALAAHASPQAPAKGRALLEAAAAAQNPGGRPYAERAGFDVTLSDEWFGLTGTLFCPWPADPQRLRFRFTPTRENGLLELLDQEQPTRWGIHRWNTWREEDGAPPAYTEDDEDVRFWLPTIQYFLEAAFRLGEAELVDHAGTSRIDGRVYDLVYLTWGSYTPHPALDQYLAWLRKDDARLERLQFTVRDVAGFVTGCAFYDDFREVDGLLLPHRVRVGADVEDPDDLLHVYTVESWRPTELDPSVYTLDPERPPRTK